MLILIIGQYQNYPPGPPPANIGFQENQRPMGGSGGGGGYTMRPPPPPSSNGYNQGPYPPY